MGLRMEALLMPSTWQIQLNGMELRCEEGGCWIRHLEARIFRSKMCILVRSLVFSYNR